MSTGDTRTAPGDREAQILEAFREVTGWSDEDVLHYVTCDRCTPICGSEEEDCPTSPHRIELKAALRAQRGGQ